MNHFRDNLTDAQNPNGKSQVYSYNVRGQLQQVNAVNSDGTTGATQMQSLYRGDGKRAWKQGADSTNRVYYFYDGDMLLGTSDENGANAGLQLWGDDGVVGTQRRDAQGVVHSTYNLYDTQGNLAQMLDETGAIVGGSNGAAAFTAWGERVPRADGALSSTSGGYGAKFGYIRDGETGFYLCTYRHYDPSAGRWITRDPIEYWGGQNLYGYVENDPINLTDPSGLAPVVPVVLISPFTGKTEYIPHGRNMTPLMKPTGVDIIANIKIAQSHRVSNNPMAELDWFKGIVNYGASWDYKDKSHVECPYSVVGWSLANEDFGNFHYGVVGRAAGIPLILLLSAAGYAQQNGGAASAGSGRAGLYYTPIGGTYPYGDDHRDSEMIKRGALWYDKYQSAIYFNSIYNRYRRP